MIVDQYLYDVFKAVSDDVTTKDSIVHNFYYGYWPEIKSRLMSESKSETLKSLRYPFIMLYPKIELEKEKEIGIYCECSPTFYFVDSSDKTSSTLAREDGVFTSTLVPLYRAFIEQMKYRGVFKIENDLVHHKVGFDHFTAYQDIEKNKLTEVVDAIELQLLNVKIYDIYA